jgi:hypothetical protein
LKWLIEMRWKIEYRWRLCGVGLGPVDLAGSHDSRSGAN